jgi:hypothetical protein
MDNLSKEHTECNALVSERLLAHLPSMLSLLEAEWRVTELPRNGETCSLLHQAHVALGSLLDREVRP